MDISLTRTSDQIQNDYKKYRGKCIEFVEEICRIDPRLIMVRGHYFCWGWARNEPHWWAVKPDGTIVDPTKAQFPSNGSGEYEPFDGICECAECGKEFKEEIGKFDSNYSFCSTKCNMRFVGLYEIDKTYFDIQAGTL